mmetsp:Transcript_40228/g.126633  ORF Transcript_40228/g.126633 Transcript_40228/m.126633 type:complete len:86 (-) Transcript_40228:30-287(-)
MRSDLIGKERQQAARFHRVILLRFRRLAVAVQYVDMRSSVKVTPLLDIIPNQPHCKLSGPTIAALENIRAPCLHEQQQVLVQLLK